MISLFVPTTFVYAPRSGDRVFAEQPRAGIVVARWANGCRHVIGGVALDYPAASPGSHWRNAARATAAAIIGAIGGIAWDENGVVRVVVPLGHAGMADRLMVGARSRTLKHGADSMYADDDTKNEAAILVDGTGKIHGAFGGRVIANLHPLPEEPCAGDAHVGIDDTTVTRRVVSVGSVRVHAPMSWGTPVVSGADSVTVCIKEA